MCKTWPLTLVGFAGGTAMAYCQLWLLLLLIIVLLLTCAALYPQHRPRTWLVMITIVLGAGYYNWVSPPPPAALPVQAGMELAGTIQDIPYYNGENTSFTLKCEVPAPYREKIRVVCLYQCQYQRGDTIKLEGDLKPPPKPGNPGEFDYSSYLAYQGIYYNLTVKAAGQAGLIKPAAGPIKWIDSFRSRAELLTRESLSQPEAAVLLGMLLGGRAGMEEEQYTDFQKTGIVHLFSVGGLHVGFLLLLTAWLCSLAGFGHRGKFWVGVCFLLVYGTMVAWPPPVIRAVLMGILGLLAYYSGRENSLLNALAISGLVILLINPANLFNLSFQLTLLATWGLVYLFPLLRERLPFKGWGWDMILIPITAELAVLPLVAYYFNLFTPISIFTNILTTYLAGGAVILGFMAFLLAFFLPSLAALFLFPAGLLIEGILFVVQWTKSIPGAYVWVAAPAAGMIVLYFIAMWAATEALKKQARRRYMLWSGTLGLIFFTSLLLPASFYNRGCLEIVFIDVGQGDAALLKTPQGRFILVDGGGSQFYDVGAKKVLPYLHYRGIRSLDMIINTHPDIDHMQGLESVAEEMNVNCLVLPASIADSEEYLPLRTTAAYKHMPVYTVVSGQQLDLEEGLEIKVLNPPDKIYEGQDFNRESIVLQVKYRDFSALLTGDLPAETMPQLLEEVDLPIFLVKVPHHGSKGSLWPDFYRKLKPHYAVISVGENNPFGHPNAGVLETLAREEIKVLRTDRDGAIVVRSDGRNLTISRTKKDDIR